MLILDSSYTFLILYLQGPGSVLIDFIIIGMMIFNVGRFDVPSNPLIRLALTHHAQ
jgi:hypothetical protein